MPPRAEGVSRAERMTSEPEKRHFGTTKSGPDSQNIPKLPQVSLGSCGNQGWGEVSGVEGGAMGPIPPLLALA